MRSKNSGTELQRQTDLGNAGEKKICLIYYFKDFSGLHHYQMKDSSYSWLSEHTEQFGGVALVREATLSPMSSWAPQILYGVGESFCSCCSSGPKRLYGRVEQWKIVLSERHPKRLHRVTHSLGVFQMCFWKPFFVPQQPYFADSDID